MHQDWLEKKVYQGLVIQYIIEQDGNSIGSVYLRDVDLRNESGEFGIFIGEADAIGKGIGRSVTTVFTEQCLKWGFHRIVLRVFSNNTAAIKCYKMAGFEFEGEAKDMVYIDGTRYDVTFMSMINHQMH